MESDSWYGPNRGLKRNPNHNGLHSSLLTFAPRSTTLDPSEHSQLTCFVGHEWELGSTWGEGFAGYGFRICSPCSSPTWDSVRHAHGHNTLPCPTRAQDVQSCLAIQYTSPLPRRANHLVARPERQLPRMRVLYHRPGCKQCY